MALPNSLRPLFWDIDTRTFDPTAHVVYVVERVLERGDAEAVSWLRKTFPADVITDVLRGSHRLSARSANFWALVFNVPRHEVRALTHLHAGSCGELEYGSPS